MSETDTALSGSGLHAAGHRAIDCESAEAFFAKES